MRTDKREKIREYLRNLANSHAALMDVLEQTMAMVCEELSLDPVLSRINQKNRRRLEQSGNQLVIDRSVLSVTFRGRSCFLGNSLPFKFLCRLAQRPNTFLSHDELLADVWQGLRSSDAVRSVVKTLRSKLRTAGLGELADAIDGSVRGHYALRLDR